jgi:hypothetical protein
MIRLREITRGELGLQQSFKNKPMTIVGMAAVFHREAARERWRLAGSSIRFAYPIHFRIGPSFE